jgi:hypothetical protein
METLAVRAWQPVSGGLFIGGVGKDLSASQGQGATGMAMFQIGASRQHSLTMSLFVGENREVPGRGKRGKILFSGRKKRDK